MIYKGCQKKLILLNDPSGNCFEQAYFILRDDIKSSVSETDMIREANRIICEAMYGNMNNAVFDSEKSKSENRNRNRDSFLWFLLGAVCGICSVIGVSILM